MIIKAVIFDMDGVLTNTMQFHIISWNYAFNQFDILPSDEDLALLEGMSYKETIETISKKYHKKLDIEDKDKIYSIKKEKLSEIVQYKTYPEVPELLNFLKKKNIKLALVSGANKEFVKSIVNKFFKDYFDIIITGNDVKKGKPNPEPYLKAIKELKFDSENIIVIENAPLGIQSAIDAGIKTFALTTTLNKRFLKNADKIFSSHVKLIKFIEKIVEK